MASRNSMMSEDDSLCTLRGPNPNPTNSDVVPYGASLFAKPKGKRRRYLFGNVTEGGIIYSAGIRENDELISVNQHRTKGIQSVETIANLIGCSSFVLLEMKRKLKRERVPFIVAFNVTIEGDKPKLHHFGFYWRTPLSEWDKVLLPVFKDIFGQCENCWNYADKRDVTISRNGRYLKVDRKNNKLVLKNGFNGELDAKFTEYKYTPCQTPNEELPVIFVHSDGEDNHVRITATGSSLKLTPFIFKDKIEEEDKLFFRVLLATTEEASQFMIKHINNEGTRYWEQSGDEIILVNNGGTPFTIQDFD